MQQDNGESLLQVPAALDGRMPSLLDREISTEDRDAFGHRHFAEALRSLIESPTNMPPFSIGLLGPWGTGKSTIKALYQSSLQQDLRKSAGGLARKDRVYPITFNAWRFGGENVKRALLRHVFLDLGGEERDLKDELFRQITRVEHERRPWRELWREFGQRFLWAPMQIITIVVVAILLLEIAGAIFHWGTRATTYLIGSFLLAGVPTTAVALWKFSPIPLLTPVNRVELPSTTAEEYEDLLVKQLHKFKDGKTKRGKGKTCERMVIFVDDLDRLSAEEMVNGLDAIRTFMDISETQLPSSLGIVFAISCDEDRVAAALADRRRRGTQDLPGYVITRGDARKYLDRIFQFRLEIPPVSQAGYAQLRARAAPGRAT